MERGSSLGCACSVRFVVCVRRSYSPRVYYVAGRDSCRSLHEQALEGGPWARQGGTGHWLSPHPSGVRMMLVAVCTNRNEKQLLSLLFTNPSKYYKSTHLVRLPQFFPETPHQLFLQLFRILSFPFSKYIEECWSSHFSQKIVEVVLNELTYNICSSLCRAIKKQLVFPDKHVSFRFPDFCLNRNQKKDRSNTYEPKTVRYTLTI